MLTGLFKCPKCGKGLFGTGNVKRNEQYYACRDWSRTSNSAGTVCTPKHYNAKRAERTITDGFCRLARCPELFVAAMQAHEQQTRPQPKQTSSREQVLADLKALADKEQATITAQIAGIQAGADPTAYAYAFAQIREQREALQATLARLDEQTKAAGSQTADPEDAANEVCARLARMEEFFASDEMTAAEKGALLATVVKEIVPCEQDGEEAYQALFQPFATETGETVKQFKSFRSEGKARPLFLMAARTRSRDS
jgi:hypothetical protein